MWYGPLTRRQTLTSAEHLPAPFGPLLPTWYCIIRYHRSVAGNGTAPSTRTDGLKVRLQSKRETTSIVRRVCVTSLDGIHRNGPPDRPPSRPQHMPRDTNV